MGLDAGDRAQQLDDLRVRGERQLDALAQVLDCGVERVDVREELGDHDAVMLDLEAAGERLAQLRNLRAHPGLRELGQLLGIADARQERFEHRPRGLRVGMRRDAGELDASVLEHLLKALDRARALVDLRLAKPRQITQPADLHRRHEARAHKPVLHELADPFGVLDVGLSPRDVVQVLRVKQPALKALLERLKHGLPVHAGCFHPDQRHPGLGEPLAEPPKPSERRAKRSRLLIPPTTTSARDADRRDHRVLDEIAAATKEQPLENDRVYRNEQKDQGLRKDAGFLVVLRLERWEVDLFRLQQAFDLPAGEGRRR